MAARNLARAAAAVVGLSASAAQAQLNGTLNFGGAIRAVGSGPVNVVLDFLPLNAGTGALTIDDLSNTGSYAVFNTFPAPAIRGTIRDLTVGLGGTYNVPSFVTLPGGYAFDLLKIAPGSFSAATCFVAAAAGQTCTPDDGLGHATVFNLSNAQNPVTHKFDATVSFSVSGIATGPQGTSPFIGTFTSQFPGQSYQQLLAAINSPTGSLRRSFSATFVVTATPEPASMALMATGLLGLAGIGLVRRRARA